jgi:NAD(P)-dependent dehydrogenase (short-subunit alcohol dehydrogenase family)
MDLQLAGKRALVTGSSAGIGKAVAIALHAEGAHVVIHGRDTAKLEAARAEFAAAPDRLAIVAGDLSDETSAQAAAADALAAFGGIDILVNNAGAVKPLNWELTNTDHWIERFQENVFSMVRMISRLAPGMKERGWGRLIQMSSASGTTALAVAPDYAAGKSAIINMSASLAKQYGQYGVTANTVSPGTVLSELITYRFAALAEKTGKPCETERDFYELMLEYDQSVAAPIKRLARLEEIADVVAFLASPRASYINGANIRIDGGNVGSVN